MPLSTAAVAHGIFIALGIGINFLHEIVLVQLIDSFPCNVVFVIFM